MRIALLAHAHHPIVEPYAGGLEMHTALLTEELVRRGHDVTLYAKAGSRTPARLSPLAPRWLRFGSGWPAPTPRTGSTGRWPKCWPGSPPPTTTWWSTTR